MARGTRITRRTFTRNALLALSAPSLAFCSPAPHTAYGKAKEATPRAAEPLVSPGSAPAPLPTAEAPVQAGAGAGHAKVGINLAGMADWNTELPFVDVFRMSRAWISQRKGAAFGEGPKLQLDADGWLKKLEPDCWAETPLAGVSRAPAGEWTVLFDGKGQVEIFGDILGQASFGNRHVFKTKPGGAGGFFLRVLATDPKQPVRNIRVIKPGFESSYAENPWDPAFLARWKGMACLRFMDFMETNNSQIRNWSDRPRLSHSTFAGRGVPVELLVDLANRQGIAPWFSMPHLASDDYVRNFASYVKDKLRPDLKFYVEYSNEVWNSMFEQHRYAAEQGKQKRYDKDDFSAAMAFYGQRSVEMFKIFEQAFGGRERMVRVVSSQAAQARAAELILGFRDVGKHVDALAIAPYVSLNADPERARDVQNWSLEKLFAYLEQTELKVVEGWIRENKQVADRYKLKLLAYEGGQHLVGVLGGENNERVEKLFLAANADVRMARLYQNYHKLWSAGGGDLFCHFSSVSGWSKWGSWGLLQEYDEDPRRSPKFMEVMRWAKQCGQNVTL